MGSGNRHVEVEKKFDVPGGTVFPSFDGLTTVAEYERQPAQSLDAVYFDTPGRDLALNRITLRRRTGGPDAGWHLKLPAGPDARTEVHAPLDTSADATDAAVPEELLDIVLVHFIRELLCKFFWPENANAFHFVAQFAGQLAERDPRLARNHIRVPACGGPLHFQSRLRGRVTPPRRPP